MEGRDTLSSPCNKRPEVGQYFIAPVENGTHVALNSGALRAVIGSALLPGQTFSTSAPTTLGSRLGDYPVLPAISTVNVRLRVQTWRITGRAPRSRPQARGRS